MTITLEPIGTVRTPYTDWAPEQPLAREVPPGRFAVVLDERFAGWLEGLDSFRYVYVLTYLDRAASEGGPRVAPPWARGHEVGLFASRSPARPNRIGLSVARLLGVEGTTLHLGPLDLLDGTPVLDVKPYVKTVDAKADATDGWIESLDGHEHLLEHLLGIPHDHAHDRDHARGDGSHDDGHDHGHSHHDHGHSHHDHDHGRDHHQGHSHHDHDHGHDHGRDHAHGHAHDLAHGDDGHDHGHGSDDHGDHAHDRGDGSHAHRQDGAHGHGHDHGHDDERDHDRGHGHHHHGHRGHRGDD